MIPKQTQKEILCHGSVFVLQLKKQNFRSLKRERERERERDPVKVKEFENAHVLISGQSFFFELQEYYSAVNRQAKCLIWIVC